MLRKAPIYKEFSFHTYSYNTIQYEIKSAQRDANTARSGCSKVRTPPARPLSQTHRQDQLQYTAAASYSAQCNNTKL